MKALDLLRAAARDAAALWRIAPWVWLLAAVPEFLQHVAEIKLGLFASRAAFQELALAPDRWFWGYWKLAGLTAGALGGAWFLLRRNAARPLLRARLVLAVALNALVTGLPLLVERLASAPVGAVVTAVATLAALPLLPFLASAIAGDPRFTLVHAYRSGWWIALRSMLLMAAGFVPLQAVHTLDHRLALGQPPALLWGLMAWDALVVGAMATWLAAATARGFLGMPLAKR